MPTKKKNQEQAEKLRNSMKKRLVYLEKNLERLPYISRRNLLPLVEALQDMFADDTDKHEIVYKYYVDSGMTQLSYEITCFKKNGNVNVHDPFWWGNIFNKENV